MRSCLRFPGGIPHLKAGTHVLLTRPPLPLLPPKRKKRTFDLHVLGTPPAFILSQDQTRHSSILSSRTLRRRADTSVLVLERSRPSVTLSLFADSSSYTHQIEIDRNCKCSRILIQLLFCFHFSIVKVHLEQALCLLPLPGKQRQKPEPLPSSGA